MIKKNYSKIIQKLLNIAVVAATNIFLWGSNPGLRSKNSIEQLETRSARVDEVKRIRKPSRMININQYFKQIPQPGVCFLHKRSLEDNAPITDVPVPAASPSSTPIAERPYSLAAPITNVNLSASKTKNPVFAAVQIVPGP